MWSTFALMAMVAAVANAYTGPKVIMMHLADDFGWANAGWHRPSGFEETKTPNMDQLVAAGIELERAHSYQFCSPSRSSLQSGRLPTHVNLLNLDVTAWNPKNNISGCAAIPRNMTCMANKLSQAGFSTHQIGKWDAGMCTPRHTPKGRGYDTSFGYFHHANNYWNEAVGPYTDLWNTSGPAFGQNSSCQAYYKNGSNCQAVGTNPAYTIGPEAIYEEHKFRDEVLRVIRQHDPSNGPLFINYDSHIVHSPLQSPIPYYHAFDFMTNDWDHHRQLYASMVHYLDDCIGDIIEELKNKNLWEDTIWFHQSDNGGPSFTGDNHTANNFPLKGAKYSQWDGGYRVNAFVSGPYLEKVAPHMIGTKLDGFVTIADYYATFCEIAGVDPTDHEAAQVGLPPIDSISMWKYFTGQVSNSPRSGMFMDHNVLYSGQYKLIASLKGSPLSNDTITIDHACWGGPYYPNATVDPSCSRGETCANGGCLYNVYNDPSEYVNLSDDPKYRSILESMKKQLYQEQQHEFDPDRQGGDKNLAAQVARDKWGGYWGPFLEL
eukprot:m.23544 g.23544  ORF g.23544 m.23544 type:complete len:547 (+) comp13190_c0_seq2:58-1698(+)